GSTFSEPVTVDPQADFQQFADLAVGPDGAVYVAFRARDRLLVSRTSDQGLSFTVVGSFTIRPFDSWYFSGGRHADDDCGDGADSCLSGFSMPRFETQPSLVVDATGAHLVWSEGRRSGQGKVVAMNSPDGVHWG